MGNEALGTPTHGEGPTLKNIEMLDEPFVSTHDGVALRILAVVTSENDGTKVPVGYVSTKSGRATMLGEFSGTPTGEYMPCNTVKGWVGENQVYGKNVSTDTPLSGLRTAVAQRRASKAVVSRLK